MTNRIVYRSSTLAYVKSGTGSKPLLLFHGFGQDHTAFQSWMPAISARYAVYSFDLFFHGGSTWNEQTPLEMYEWKSILESFLQQEKIDEFDVGGFSLGGKFALATLQAFPKQVSRIILIAPDGIKTSFWYSLATYPVGARALFRSMIVHPSRLHRLARLLRTLRLVDAGLIRFAESQMDTEERRRRVYHAWVYFRHLRFDLDEIARLINQHSISLTLVVGQHDKVIVPSQMHRLLGKLEHYAFEIINSGHTALIQASASYLWSKE